MTNPKELSGRVALITGVSRRAGIGAAIALELARAGASVFLSFFRGYDQAQAWGLDAAEPESLLAEMRALVEADAYEADLSIPSAPAEVFAAARRRFGDVDILVNNAAHWEPGGVERIDAEQLDRHYAVNSRAAVLLCSEFARHKSPTTAGRIVNVTSGQGQGPMPGELAYVVTKAALDALTVSLAAELAGRGITVNAVDPGPTDTGWMTDSQKAELAKLSPTGSVASPRDTARVVRALVGPHAFNTSGQVLRVQPNSNSYRLGAMTIPS